MNGRSQYSRAGGSILAVSIIGGTIAGMIAGQSSIGFIAGTVVGLALLLLVWVGDRKR